MDMETTTESLDESPKPSNTVSVAVSALAAELRECAGELRALQAEAPALLGSGRTADRRRLYARSELIAMRVSALAEGEAAQQGEEEKRETERETESLLSQCAALSAEAKLLFRAHPLLQSSTGVLRVLYRTLHVADELFRLCMAFSFLMLGGTFLALPCILLVPLDYLLMGTGLIRPSQQLSVNCKRFIAYGVLKLAGIHLVVERESERDELGKECSLICFSHSSTLDAFIFSAVFAVRHYTLSKAELYLIPFFSWCLIAFGGIPIDRKNRDKAVRSVQLAVSSARGGDCVCISPEGTRSTTGHILPFKKGPFYMWEDLKTPIVPIVIYGAFELYPPKHYMTLTGRVYARILAPIPATAASTREEMSRLVRRRMLEAWRDGPEDAAAPLNMRERLDVALWTLVYLGVLYLFSRFFPLQSIEEYLQVSRMGLVGLFFAASIGITLVFYVYFMYLSLPIASFKQKLFGGKVVKSKKRSEDKE